MVKGLRRSALLLTAFLLSAVGGYAGEKELVDYVNPYIGNISHLLVPTFPNVHLPNSLLRFVPERADFTSDRMNGLPVTVTHHRERSAFNISPYQGDDSGIAPVPAYGFDNEDLRPYRYSVRLEEPDADVDFAPSHQSAVYSIRFNNPGESTLLLNTRNGAVRARGNTVEGYQHLGNGVRLYLYLETEQTPAACMTASPGSLSAPADTAFAEGRNACVALRFNAADPVIGIRYGISLISTDQARRNLRREISVFSVDSVAGAARDVWNRALGALAVEGDDEDDKTVFYTSYYRTFERPVCLSEDGRYFSASDGRVHSDEGRPFYTDDWIWDTYRAAHPLRALIEPRLETDIIRSYLRMAQQTDSLWMPTFPEITGDSRRMNSNHGVCAVADAWAKGLHDFDLALACDACRRAIENKTLAPWRGTPAGKIDAFYKEHGYIPALYPGEKETDPNVHGFENRQPVAVTLGTAYDQFCLSRIAAALGDSAQARHYAGKALNYRNLYNPETRFFHPKDSAGRFIEPFDYRWPGGMGSREYYGENNAWVYRWDVPHNVADLVALMGGPEVFCAELDRTFNEPLGRQKYQFYAQLPDHTGNVGQFSMANEPSLHIPYLYNYAGQPWKTQKRIRRLIEQWFRNDLMGLPGDEDGGGMTSFVVFSMLGIYPVTPGIPVYNIGSPFFRHASVALPGGRTFEIDAPECCRNNKYILSAELNGRPLDRPWLTHDEILAGGYLTLHMGDRPNKSWGAAAPPPSM